MPISKDYNLKTGQYGGRICRFCNKEVKGRITKVFCDDRCRVNYRNEINKFKRTRDLHTEAEAHNYFLLIRELESRDVPVSLTGIDLTALKIYGFDFGVPMQKFIEGGKITWFCTGDLAVRVFPEKNEIKVRHFSRVNEERLTNDGEISLEKAYPELGLRTLYKGPL